MPDTVLIGGSLAQRPGHGGHTWVFLQYLLGFRRMGWDVLFVDRLEPEMCVDEQGRRTSLAASWNLAYTQRVMERFGLGQSWALLYDGSREVVGLSRADLHERARNSALLINVMGFIDDEDLLGAVPLRVFLDIDPGFGHMWQELGLAEPFHDHDRYATVGGRIGRDDCAIPTCGIEWIPVLPCVELSEWPAAEGARDLFTSVSSWRGPFGPIEYGGRTYGLRVHEFRRFFELPQRARGRFEVALDIDDADETDLQGLREHGWALKDPRQVAADPWRYREYLKGSAAEVMIAKNLYVDTRSGWFSDRSACYLASGKPVLAQDTGLGGLLPVGAGLLPFSTLDEAVAGAEEITADYDRHSQAARAIAAEHLAAERVLPRLLDAAGVR
jgi:hypothetical protein